MKYVGIHTQQSRNNARSVVLLILFPCLVVALTYVFCYLLVLFTSQNADEGYPVFDVTNTIFLQTVFYVIAAVLLWFVIAWFSHTSIIS